VLIPRGYQLRAVERARESWRAGRRAILLVGPTGMGKTVLATLLGGAALRKGKRVAFFVHREELEEQAAAAFARIGVRAGIVRAGETSSAQFRVVSIQTAARRDVLGGVDLAFLDEAHHFASPEWSVPVRALRERGAGLIGLTATPDRGDGRGLAPLFDDLVVVAQPKELIAAGHLVPCRVIGPGRARRTLAAHPVDAWMEHARGRRTIVFCGTVGHARKLAAGFAAAGVRARCVDGEMPDDARRGAIASFRDGGLDVLTSVQVLTEGFDAPETSCVILTTGASAPAPLIQKVGRGMRPAPGKIDCLVIDLKASCREVGILPDDDREFSLDGRAIAAGASDRDSAVVQCRGCGRWYRADQFADSACPGCGRGRRGREDPAVRRARLAVYSARMPSEERTLWLARKITEGRSKRRRDGTADKAVGWALQQYMARYRTCGPRPDQAQLRAAVALADRMGGDA